MALVDDALRRKKENARLESAEFKGRSEYDELGLKIKDTSDYTVARILKLNPELHTDQGRRIIYDRGGIIIQNSANLYRLSQSRRMISPNFQQIIWAKLLILLPVLDNNKIWVCDDLIWDAEKGELSEYGDTGGKVQE